MSDSEITNPPRSVTSVWPALVIVAFGIGIFVWSYAYGTTARRFPQMVAGSLIVLGVIDAWSRLPVPGRDIITEFWGTSFERREMTHVPGRRAEIALVCWVLAAFAGMATFGILAALPVFCFAYAFIWAQLPWKQASIVALVLLVFEITVFEWLLDYELYRGLLFSEGGLARW
jgi:hypothetical protein